MKIYFQPFHLVSVSPWPVMMGVGVFFFVVGLVNFFLKFSLNLVFLSFFDIMVISILWWRDIARESTFEGSHTKQVEIGLVMGMILFILSELMLFVSFFWTFFHSSLSPAIELGMVWPPLGVETFNPFQIPLLNTVILLSSGVSVTWAHQCVLMNSMVFTKKSLLLTWVLGLYFIFLQLFEYMMAGFSISDSVFGSVFFLSTGFHGFHVMVGSLFLIVIWGRLNFGHFSEKHHFGFEASVWYWHFVDVVWLFLFSMVYWWGG